MEPNISREELAFLFQRAGLDVAAETITELHGVYRHVEAMIERVNARGEGEPIPVFAPVELPS
jgi:hypothetical protein